MEDEGSTINVLMLGAQGAGKTCLVSGLAVLSSPMGGSQKFLYWAGRNDRTKSYINDRVAELHRGIWPAKSAQHIPIELTVNYSGKHFNLNFPDFPGEQLFDALTKGEHDRFPELKELLIAADVILLLLSPTQVGLQALDPEARPENEVDWKDREGRVRWLHGLIQGVFEACSELENECMIGIVLTQSDRYSFAVEGDVSRSAERYIEQHLPRFVQKIRAFGRRTRIFAISAVGKADEEGRPPERLRPWGYEELFDWIKWGKFRIKNKRRLRSKPAIASYVVFAIPIIVFPFAWVQGQWKIETVESQNASIEDAARAYMEIWWSRDSLNARADHALDARLDHMEKIVSEERRLDRLRELDETLSQISGLSVLEVSRRAESLHGEVEGRKEIVLYGRVIDERDGNGASLMAAIGDYLDRFPSGYRSDGVRELRDDHLEEEMRLARREVRDIRPDRRREWHRRIRAIESFLNEHHERLSPREVREIGRAGEVAGRIADSSTYDIRVRRLEELAHQRKVRLTFYRNGEAVHVLESEARATRPSWTGRQGEFSMRWDPDDELMVQVEIGRRGVLPGYMNAGGRREAGPLGLELFNGRKIMNLEPERRDDFVRGPFVLMEVSGIREDDWELLRRYFYPGRWWRL